MKRRELKCDHCHGVGGNHRPGCTTLDSMLKAVGARLKRDEREQSKVGASK